MGSPYDKGEYRPVVSYAFEQVTISTASLGFTSTKYDPGNGTPAIHALVTVESAQIRYTVDGTTPTTMVGHLKEVGDEFEVWGSTDIKNFRAIRTGGTDASLAVTYGR